MLEELYGSVLLFQDGTKFIKNEHIDDDAINGFKIRDNSISRRHMRDKSIDKINFTDELRDEFDMDKMSPFYYEAREIPLNF